MTDLRATNAPMSPDERDDLALAAERSRRANQPTHLVVLAALLLVGASGGLALGWRGLAGERRDAARLGRDLAEVRALTGRIEALEAAARSDPSASALQEIPTILTDIENLALDAGLTSKPQVPKREARAEGDAGRRVTYAYTGVADASLASLLEWVRLVLAEVPGTFVQNLDITPQPGVWRVNVTFARFERNG